MSETCNICGEAGCGANWDDPMGAASPGEYEEAMIRHWRLGYERLSSALAAAESRAAAALEVLRLIARPKPSVDMADPVEQQLSDALHEIGLIRSMARAALSGEQTPSRPMLPVDAAADARMEELRAAQPSSKTVPAAGARRREVSPDEIAAKLFKYQNEVRARGAYTDCACPTEDDVSDALRERDAEWAAALKLSHYDSYDGLHLDFIAPLDGHHFKCDECAPLRALLEAVNDVE